MHRPFRCACALWLATAFPIIVCAETPAPDDRASVRLIFVGDIMLDDGPGRAVARGIDPFAPFTTIFDEADVVVGNLECVVATTGQPFDKKYTFRAHPRVIPLLKRHFDALSIANNHTGDYGDEAFVEQLDLLHGRVGVFGGGRDQTEARRPLILERHGLRIALLGSNEFKPRAFEAGPDDPGVAWSVDERVLADIRAAREVHRADIVLPYLHWGHEYDAQPDDRQRTFARAMLEAGASAVIGAHPHVTQGAEIVEGRPVVYSLGNFVFDGFDEPEAKVGWLLRTTVDRRGVAEWDTVVIRIDEQGLPRPDATTPGPRGRRDSDAVDEAVPELPAK